MAEQMAKDKKKKRQQEVGNRLRFFRDRAGLTQEQLAEKAGVEPSTIYRYETGSRGIPLMTAGDICRELHISTDELLYGRSDSYDNLSYYFSQLSPEEQAFHFHQIKLSAQNPAV